MGDLKQEFINYLIDVEKSLLEGLTWGPRYRNPLRDNFRINILSLNDDQFVFEGYFNRETKKILLTLRYKTIALVTLHKGIHTNPDGTMVRGWHKQLFREREHRKIANDVNDEFNDQMTKRQIIEDFMGENNIHYAGQTYQENIDAPY